MNQDKLTHIAGTFIIHAPASFLNGAGLGEGEDRNVSIVKTFRDGAYKVPYVSSQAWKRWLRNTMIEETGWNASIIRALHVNEKGNTDKIGGEFNPVEFPEDDLFGYMRTEKGAGTIVIEESESQQEVGESSTSTKQKGKRVKSVMRASPFSASILVSLRKTGWQGRDEGYVHLKEGTPQPYTTQFYDSNLQGVFSLNYKRLGVFSNIGDRIEIDETLADAFIKDKKLEVLTDQGKSGLIYGHTDAKNIRKQRASALMKSLSHLRGGAKQAAFGTDVSPKILILAGLSCGNPIFNSMFVDDGNGLTLDTEILKEVVEDYSDRICTPVHIGVRKGYLKNDDEVRSLSGHTNNGISFNVNTPIEAAENMANCLE